MSSIDVVIPCYRYGRYLRECVQSVLTQGVSNVRVLIIDDESPDETPDIGAALAQEDSRVTYRRHVVNRGHISTYNEGIEWTNADYMLLLSADDYLLPGALQRAMALMDAHPEVGLCFGQALELFDDGRTSPIVVNVETRGEPSIVVSGADFVRLSIRAGAINIVPTPTAIVKTRLLKLLGGYSYDMPHSGDLELWLRLAGHAPVGILKANQAMYRRHASSMSVGYCQDHCLSDLQQRKLAFDAFLHACRHVLPGTEHLHRGLLKALASAAVSHSNSAFNSNRLALSLQLCEFAANMHAGVRRSRAWNVLTCKRLIGFRVSSTLLPTFARIRAAALRIRKQGQ